MESFGGISKCELSSSVPLDSTAIRYRLSPETYLYGLADTHNANNGLPFALQQIAEEILLTPLNTSSDEEIKEVLRDAFMSVENTYTQKINEIVAQRTSLQYELPDDYTHEMVNTLLDEKYKSILTRLKEIDEQLSIGITCVVALIHKDKLFVANIGKSRALLCKTDDNFVLRVVQLSVDHSLNNEDELLRLSQLGLDTNKLKEATTIGNQSSTRCLGNYLIKQLYAAYPDLKHANGEPVISLPEVQGPFVLDQSCRFLVLMSDKLYLNLQESTDTEQVNKQLAQMVVEQLRTQPTLEATCQNVVVKIMNLYSDYSKMTCKPPWTSNRNTLLIRNFNFTMPNAPTLKSPVTANRSNVTIEQSFNAKDYTRQPELENKVRFNPVVQSRSPAASNDSDVDMQTDRTPEYRGSPYAHSQNSSNNDSFGSQSAISTMTSQYSQNSNAANSSSSSNYSTDIEEKRARYNSKRIPAYVDFTPYYKNLEAFKKDDSLAPNLNLDSL